METESAEMRPECLKNAFNRFESLEFTVLSSVPGIYSLSDFIRKYPGCKVVFIKQSFKLQDFCSTFRRTDWFSTNFGIRGPELRSFYWIILHHRPSSTSLQQSCYYFVPTRSTRINRIRSRFARCDRSFFKSQSRIAKSSETLTR